jgi:hypothetical protein
VKERKVTENNCTEKGEESIEYKTDRYVPMEEMGEMAPK